MPLMQTGMSISEMYTHFCERRQEIKTGLSILPFVPRTLLGIQVL